MRLPALLILSVLFAGCGMRTGSRKEAVRGAVPALEERIYEIRNAGATVNSASNDYAPAVTSGQRRLYLVSDRPGGVGGHDLWLALRSIANDSLFEQARPIDGKFNTIASEGAITVSADESLVIYSACGIGDGPGDCDLYEARPQPGKSVAGVNMSGINSPGWDSSPSLSPDGRTLFFSSTRPGALGGKGDADIYISTFGSDGRWSTPRNPGAPLNSPKKEDSPSVSPDGRMIFFSSARDGGEGGFDFYLSHRADDGSWSVPVNLGPIFNSSRDERFIASGAGGAEIYFASDRVDLRNFGKLDIFIARRVAGAGN